MSMMNVLEHLCDDFASALANGFDARDTLSELELCANVSERLQRRRERYVVVHEAPYPGPSVKNERLADLKVYIKHGSTERSLWLECKPFCYGSAYWRHSKFFSSYRSRSPWLSTSIILMDIERRTLVPGDPFVLLLILANEAPTLARAEMPIARRRLQAGEVYDLCYRKMDAASDGGHVTSVVRRLDATDNHGSFDIVALCDEP
jgi:hypothetical protein